MKNQFTVRGVPTSISQDGWWLTCSEGATNSPEKELPYHEQSYWKPLTRLPLLGILLLVPLADFLFWHHSLGLSLTLFAIAIFGVATYRLPLKSRYRPAILLAFGVLPAVEYVQILSLIVLTVTLVVALIWAHRPTGHNTRFFTAAFRLLFAIPLSGFISVLRYVQSRRTGLPGASSRVLIRNWAFPLGGSLVFFSLLVDANPFFAQVLSIDIDFLPLCKRIGFWLGVGLLIWPLVDGFKFDDRAFSAPNRLTRIPNLGLNADSVLRALVMFNLLIGVQVWLDFSIFVGGGDLPDGMTYASYAHRGAYPLVITALLAGAFALSARPFLAGNSLLKPLLMLWLVQNVILCLSAALRLELYVEAYGLTYLRVRALIWMGVVALGLAISIWQILYTHSNRWLIVRCGALGATTLYLCCFVNFAALIAKTNISHQHGSATYICDLGPTASRAIDEAMTNAEPESDEIEFFKGLKRCPGAPTIDGWRDWGVRKWRVAG
jgi:Domain of unknown function (DUF4153)